MDRDTAGTPARTKKPGVVRIAAGERRKQTLRGVAPTAAEIAKGAQHAPQKTIRRAGNVVELNPRMESSRGVIPKVDGKTPMSVAERQRAAAEAAFQQIAPAWTAQTTAVEPPPQETSPQFRKSEFEIRISQRDSLTTALRMSADRAEGLRLARELADRFQLPPDQSVLVKVMGLGNEELTKLALEELLELDDRGRVRSTDELVEALQTLQTRDKDTGYLRDLFMEKLGLAASG